jgi:hypothetical protein
MCGSAVDLTEMVQGGVHFALALFKLIYSATEVVNFYQL